MDRETEILAGLHRQSNMKPEFIRVPGPTITARREDVERVMGPLYTLEEIKTHWKDFKKKPVYRCLVNGRWVIRTNYDAARKLGAIKIDLKPPKDFLDFPEYLKAITDADNAG